MFLHRIFHFVYFDALQGVLRQTYKVLSYQFSVDQQLRKKEDVYMISKMARYLYDADHCRDSESKKYKLQYIITF